MVRLPIMSRKASVLVSHRASARPLWFGEQNVSVLAQKVDVVLNEGDRVLFGNELVQRADGCSIILLDRETEVTAAIMDELPGLVAIVRAGVDTRRIDVAAASERGILVSRVQPAYAEAVSELIVGLIIDAARDITKYANSFKSGRVPSTRPGRQISGAVIGLIGYGAIARRLAVTLDVMGAELLIHDPYISDIKHGRCVTLEELLQNADYIVPLAPANDETRNLIDAQALSHMKDSAWLINCSRGDLVDEDALLNALDRKVIAGAALDVGLAPDQLPTMRLARHTNVIATPHIGGITAQSVGSQGLQSVQQAFEILEGIIPRNALNKKNATRLRNPH